MIQVSFEWISWPGTSLSKMAETDQVPAKKRKIKNQKSKKENHLCYGFIISWCAEISKVNGLDTFSISCEDY